MDKEAREILHRHLAEQDQSLFGLLGYLVAFMVLYGNQKEHDMGTMLQNVIAVQFSEWNMQDKPTPPNMRN